MKREWAVQSWLELVSLYTSISPAIFLLPPRQWRLIIIFHYRLNLSFYGAMGGLFKMTGKVTSFLSASEIFDRWKASLVFHSFFCPLFIHTCNDNIRLTRVISLVHAVIVREMRFLSIFIRLIAQLLLNLEGLINVLEFQNTDSTGSVIFVNITNFLLRAITSLRTF